MSSRNHDTVLLYVLFLPTGVELQDILQEASRLFPAIKKKTIPWGARQQKILENWQDQRGDIFIAGMEQNVPPQSVKCQMCRSNFGAVRYIKESRFKIET